jgi:hypothetical protein
LGFSNPVSLPGQHPSSNVLGSHTGS